MTDETARLAALDKAHLWHPFTPMADWTDPGHEPLVLVSGRGAWLTDSRGRRYLDGNSSIWTNIHGHAHPRINEAIRLQLEKTAHTSFLGFTNPPAIELARRLLHLFPDHPFDRVFYSDDGSTAIEVAMKMTLQYWQQTGHPEKVRFAAFENAYHGDTFGAAALGGVSLFFDRFRHCGLPVSRVGTMRDLEALPEAERNELAAVVIEPVIQGVAGMRPWPPGLLSDLRHWCDRHGVLLIADEIMTGFGRTGTMFACQQEGVHPDFMALAKGLSGGYLPLAATLVPKFIYDAFLNEPGSEDRTFYYGHSYTGNPLGCAAALASLDLFDEEKTLERLPAKITRLGKGLERLDKLDVIAETRQVGLISGIEIGAHIGGTGQGPVGAQVCRAARGHGLLTRPIRNTVTLMPPLCVTEEEIDQALHALELALLEVCA